MRSEKIIFSKWDPIVSHGIASRDMRNKYLRLFVRVRLRYISFAAFDAVSSGYALREFRISMYSKDPLDKFNICIEIESIYMWHKK